MGVIRDAANVTYPDGLVTDPDKPDKFQIRSLFGTVEDQVSAATAGMVRVKTLADLTAIAGTRVGQPGEVYDDGVNTGAYSWGGSSWGKVGDIFNEASASLVFGNGIDGVFKLLRARPTFANGASASIGDDNRELGFSVPLGQTGQNSVLRYQWDIDDFTGARLVNAVVQAGLAFYCSATFDRSLNITVNQWKADGSVVAVTPTLVSSSVGGQFRIFTIQFDVAAGTSCLEFVVTQTASTIVAVAQSATLINLLLQVASTVSDPTTPNFENTDIGSRMMSLAALPDVGPVFDDATSTSFLFAGAVGRVDDNGRVVGWTIPAGQSGINSVIVFGTPISPELSAALAGSTVEWSYLCNHSVGYSRNILLTLQNQDGVLATYPTRQQPISDTESIIAGKAIIVDGTRELMASFRQATDGNAVADEYFEVVDATVTSIASLDPLRPSGRLASYWGHSRLKTLGTSAIDHATIGDSVIRPTAFEVDIAPGQSINTATFGYELPIKGNRRRLQLARGQYTENRIFLKSYDALVGAGPSMTSLDGSQPANSALADISAYSTIESYFDADYYGFYARARNCRYAAHTDLPTETKDVVQRWRNCLLVHEGNQDAIDYQTSLGPSGNPAGVWATTCAWGVGLWSGWDLSAENCAFIGGYGGIVGHNNLNLSKPAKLSYRNCTIVGRDAGAFSLQFGSLGAGVQSSLTLEGCSIQGDIQLVSLPWLQTTLDYQPADHHELLISGFGNTPAVFRIDDFGRALKIESAATVGTSTVSVSGNAVAVLFGDVVQKPGAGGIKGYAYGSFDISGRAIGPNYDLVITSLGKRLGDCTTNNKVLTISVNGAAGINVVFNADYTNATNATILGMINSALGTSATASEYAIGERYRPYFTDEERRLKNISAEGILMGMACAYANDDGTSIRKMTSADPVTIFAGVAWEDIYPNTFGRLKIAGYLYIGDILRSDSGAVTTGTAFSIDSSAAGYFKVGGSTTVVTAFRSDAVRVVTADHLVALGGSTVQGPPGIGIPSTGGANGYLLGYSGGTGLWRSPAQALSDIGGAPLASPALTGTPTAPTPATNANDTSIATAAFVQAVVAALVNSAPAQLDTLKELADALGDDANFANTMTAALAGKQPLDATLTALAAIVTATDKVIYATGSDTFATADFTAVARTLLAATTQSAQRTALGLGSAAVENVGTSGNAIGKLNAANTWTGDQTIDKIAANWHALFMMNVPAGFNSAVVGEKAGKTHWQLQLGNSETMSGSNTGSNVTLARFDDNSNFLDNPIKVTRSSGVVSFSQPLQVPSYTVATVPSAAANPQGVIYVSNGTSNKRFAISDGTNWRFPDGAIIS